MHIVSRFPRLGWGRLTGSAALGLALIVTPAVSRAQAAPTPAPSAQPSSPGITAGSSASNSSPGQAAQPTHPVGHLPIIDVSPVFTQPLDYTNSAQLKGFQSLDFNATIRVPVTRDFSLTFDRVIGGTLDVPLAQVAIPIPGHRSEIVAPGVSRDIVLFYHGTYVFKKYLTIDAGDAFRHREFNSGGNGVSGAPFPASYSSTEAHWAYLGATYATHPIKELGNTNFFFTEQGEEQNVDHHVGLLCEPGPNVGVGGCGPALFGTDLSIDENPHQNKYYTTQQTVGLTIPFDAKRTATLTVQDGWGALSWYENAAFPYSYSGIEQAVLAKRFNSTFTLSLRARQYFQHEQGEPFPSPNVIHLGSVDVIGTFHLDTKTLFQ